MPDFKGIEHLILASDSTQCHWLRTKSLPDIKRAIHWYLKFSCAKIKVLIICVECVYLVSHKLILRSMLWRSEFLLALFRR